MIFWLLTNSFISVILIGFKISGYDSVKGCCHNIVVDDIIK